MRHCTENHVIAGDAAICPLCGRDTQPGPPPGMTEEEGQELLAKAFTHNQNVRKGFGIGIFLLVVIPSLLFASCVVWFVYGYH